MNLKRIYAIYLRQLYLLRHNGTRFANIFIWIALDIILWGFITKYLNTLGDSLVSFVPLLLGAVILWDFLIRIQQGVMLAFFEDVWSQNFLNLFSSPLTLAEYGMGLVLTSITTGSAGLILMLTMSQWFFGYNIFAFGWYLVPFLIILFGFGLSLGILAAGIVIRFGPAAEWFAWPIPFILGPFCGIYYPIAVLPPYLQTVASLMAPSYAFEGMRSLLFGQPVASQDMWLGIILAALSIALAFWFFVFIYKQSLKQGRIAKFDAEGGNAN